MSDSTLRKTYRRTPDGGLDLATINGVPLEEMTSAQIADVLWQESNGFYEHTYATVEDS